MRRNRREWLIGWIKRKDHLRESMEEKRSIGRVYKPNREAAERKRAYRESL